MRIENDEHSHTSVHEHTVKKKMVRADAVSLRPYVMRSVAFALTPVMHGRRIFAVLF